MNPKETNSERNESERSKSKLTTALGVGGVALLALAIFPRSNEAPAPVPEPMTYTDLAQESAQIPYDPSTDELVIDGIRIKPGDPARNSASEAVLGNQEVQSYMASNPAEAPSLEASSLSLPTNETGEYVVVKRDIDNDGDTDAVATLAK